MIYYYNYELPRVFKAGTVRDEMLIIEGTAISSLLKITLSLLFETYLILE